MSEPAGTAAVVVPTASARSMLRPLVSGPGAGA